MCIYLTWVCTMILYNWKRVYFSVYYFLYNILPQNAQRCILVNHTGLQNDKGLTHQELIVMSEKYFSQNLIYRFIYFDGMIYNWLDHNGQTKGVPTL